MPSVWFSQRQVKDGVRYVVRYRAGGREAPARYGGSFKSKRLATIRAAAIERELADLRIPELHLTPPTTPAALLFADAAERWRASRIDVSERTRLQQRTSVNHAVRILGDRRVDEVQPRDIAAMIEQLHVAGLKASFIRKILQATAMVFDHSGVAPNPARDKVHVRLPRDPQPEIAPPTAGHVQTVHRLLPKQYRLPLLVLDATGMRLGELEALTWGDIDEPRGRWRVSQTVSKTKRARWVHVQPVLFTSVTALLPRDDRTPKGHVFHGFGGDRFRTAITRACTAAGIPTFSPHDLRHRRISLLHLSGVPWARIGEHVGQRNLAVTANTYTHVLVDEAELDYAALLTMT